MKITTLIVLLTLTASGAQAKDKAKEPLRPDVGMEPVRLLTIAREARETSGCAAAAPTYRVVAGMGESQEPAQHELGECLLFMDGSSPTETALFRQEGVFWLTRAAYAGNARAQRALAVFYGAKSNSLGSPAEALKWALVYQKNREADLYGYKSLPETFVPGLKKDAPPPALAAAETFAASFTPLAMAKFNPPPKVKKGERDDGPPLPGERRPPDHRAGS